jgi:hypothetical protein
MGAMQRKDKFNATMYVTAYELARDGLLDEQIARSLGVQGTTFRGWCGKSPALADAVARGRHRREPGNELAFHEYIYAHLSPTLRDVWDEINACEYLTNAVERVEALLGNCGKNGRQHLFLYSLTQSCFNVSKSLRKLNISRKTYEHWVQHDPDFAELVDEVEYHKKNFFETAFIGRVAAGDTAAILHAVRTKCRDRGYSDKIEVEHTGTVQHLHTVDVADLPLDVEVYRMILAALRAHTAANPPPALPGLPGPTVAVGGAL